ncbi:MAG: sensor domain-containing diguanylate cyclase [Clostridiaceae bacterium]
MNRSHDKVNQSFLWFLSVVIVWMVLSICSEHGDNSTFGVVVKTVYWISMMNLSVFFLLFTYRLVRRKFDALLVVTIVLNTLTIAARYCFPIDYTDPTFWRLTTPIVAPTMSTVFSLPAIYALILVFCALKRAKDSREHGRLSIILWGIGLALIVSVISEYLLPTVFHIETHLYLMYYAFLIFIAAIFISIMRFRLFNMRSDYVYRRLFLNSAEGIVIIGKNGKIISINNVARVILRDENLDAGDRLSDYINDYCYETDYTRHEVVLTSAGQKRYIVLTQYLMDETMDDSSKLLLLIDVTQERLEQIREKDMLIEKSNIDPLTGLFSKQYLMEKYSATGGQTVPMSLLFLDVDDFKAINDRYGHMVGDRVLKGIADCMKTVVRSGNDTVRFGGDEFVVVLENTKAEDAYLVAERIRGCVAELRFCDCAPELRITLSIGLIEGEAPLSELIGKADRAMYASKNKGKDATTIFQNDSADSAFHMKLS